jgi:hypothetical protein
MCCSCHKLQQENDELNRALEYAYTQLSGEVCDETGSLGDLEITG